MTTTLRQAAATLLRGRSDARVLAAMGPQQPDGLLRAIVDEARARDLELTLLFADLSGAWAFLDDRDAADVAGGRLHLVTLAGATPRRWAGLADYVPLSLWDVDRSIATGRLRVDVLVATVVEGSKTGRAAFGDMVGYTAAALGRGEVAVGLDIQQGRAFPGAPDISLGRAEVVVRSDGPTADESVPRRPSGADGRSADLVGRQVAALVPDGATLQLGLGAVPEAVAAHLEDKRNLGLHSGILAPALRRLIERGVINGTAKSLDAARHVATGVLEATASTSSTAAGNDVWGGDVELRPVSSTHAPDLLLGQARLWAINSAFEVDLAGQPNAEYVGGQRVASAGGQADFVRAAHASSGGAAVLALPARTRTGQSRIVGRLAVPVIAASPASDVDIVVTEYGVAHLTGRTAAERVEAMIAIAHPDDRPALARGAHEVS